MTKIAFLDIETTGLDPRKHEILEVAIIVRSSGTERVHFSLGIDESRASEKALTVNGYFDRVHQLRNLRVTRARAARLLKEALTDAVVVGNNPQFDLRFIEQFLINQGEENPTPWNYHPVDLKALVAGIFRLGPPPWSTKDITKAVKVLPENAHTAMGDAQWNVDVYDNLMKEDA